MSRIISISRRTDIPAFYHEWFSNRIEEGLAGYENPFGGQKYLVSLKKEDVTAFVFWSKNYRPFLPVLKKIQSLGYNTMFNYTITGLPHIFECNLVPTEDAIDSLKEISRTFSPEHINWRYDPIVISSATPVEYQISKFSELCEKLNGYVHRCYFSFAIMYGKVERNFKDFQLRNRIKITDPPIADRITLADQFSKIASRYKIQMFTCCGEYLINNDIKKAHCIDGEIISRLFFNENWSGNERPTRKECGCTESVDIGKYNTCPHGCIYCYANVNKISAEKSHSNFDNESVFLGYTKEDSEQFLLKCKKPIENKKRDVTEQLRLDL